MTRINHLNQLHEVTSCYGGDGSSEWETFQIRADEDNRYWIGMDCGRDTTESDLDDFHYWDGPFTFEQTVQELDYWVREQARYCDRDDFEDVLNDLKEYNDTHQN